MKKKSLLLTFLLVLCAKSYSQFDYEKGYFINTANEKVECLIYDVDWKSNPTSFDYKLNKNSPVLTETIQSSKEFGFDGGAKFVRAIVEIDRSTDDVKKMGAERNPIFKKEILFLKSIIEGKASLFYYRDDRLIRYFIQNDDAEIIQLVYKRYRRDANKIAKNTYFKQQLLNDLKCDKIQQSEIESLKYEVNDLEKLVLKYNQCQNSKSLNFNEKPKRDLFNLAVRPGIDLSSLNVYSNYGVIRNVAFKDQQNFRIGVEIEYIPFYYKSNWSIIVEPTYQSFSGDETYQVKEVAQKTLNAVVEYSSIEIPVGVRYSAFINKSSKLFFNVQYLFDINLNTSFKYYRADGSVFDDLEINAAKSFALGVGFKLKEKYIVELRYLTPRQILDSFVNFNSNYNKMSVIIGYNFM